MPREAPLVECVPNFSEGRDMSVIGRITDRMESVSGVRVLDVDPGRATNRTVVTLVGPPDAVVEAAFRAIAEAAEVIDMRRHSGEHPRMGATDVCPLVPISGISMAETVEYAKKLGARVGTELGIPVYLYEHAATSPERRNLANVRAGEYEGLAEKLANPAWQPDYGPAVVHARAGATAIGAREFLVAYNVNLNTTSTRRANAVAFDIREKGRIKRRGHPLTGEVVRDEEGKPEWVPGTLKAVKAIGWYIEEYGICQVSINLTNLSVTPLHVAFDEACRKAEARGLRVTGSEIVGLVPLQVMLDAGRHYLRRQQRSLGIPEEDIVAVATRSLGLNDVTPFDPAKKIIEYILQDPSERPLAYCTLRAFSAQAASEAPAPGGGSVAAYVGALGAALGTMVANLSAHKRGWDERWHEYSAWAEKGEACRCSLVRLVDDDTRAFDAIMAAHRMPSGTPEERSAAQQAVEAATKEAIEVPLHIMRAALGSMEVMRAMAEAGLPSSVSDAGAGAICARAAVRAAFLNVEINAPQLADESFRAESLEQGRRMLADAQSAEEEILALVGRVMAGAQG